MRLLMKAAALSMCCLALTAASCGEKRVVQHIPIPPARLVCEPVPARPTILNEHKIDWSKVKTVEMARSEFDQYVRIQRSREGTVATHLIAVEGQLFACWNNMEWIRAREAELKG